MIKRLCFLFGILISFQLSAQKLDSIQLFSKPVYTSLEEAMTQPDSVYRLHLKRKKLKEIPLEVLQLKNLQELNLSRNRFDTITIRLDSLKDLWILDLSKNKFKNWPEAVNSHSGLEVLSLNRNPIEIIPSSIQGLQSLVFLDIWGTWITVFPNSISQLQYNLRYIDMRQIHISFSSQEIILQQLPYTRVLFSQGCNCD